MKKKSFNFSFKSNFFKEQDPFHLVVAFFIIFFGTAIFFSIPTFYDYEKYNQKIEDAINKDYKINLHNLEDISFRFIPSPHLFIKKADFKINKNEKEIISEFKNIRVFISIIDFYQKDKFKIKRMVVNKANIYLNNDSLKNLINNLKTNIVNLLKIKKSTLFFKDKKGEIILISKIKELDYKIDFINNKKIFNINGNIFDSNYEFKYLIDYRQPNIQNILFELVDPNLFIENTLTKKKFEEKVEKLGDLNIGFLNQKNNIKYIIKDGYIDFENNSIKNSNFDLNGKVSFEPFHFDLIIDLKKINLLQLENLFYLIHRNKTSKFQNLSGKTKLKFNQISNKVLKSGFINLIFEGSELITSNNEFYLNNFATLIINEYKFLEDNEQIVQMKLKLDILDNEKFNRFLFNFKKNMIDSKSLYFTYQYNANSKNSFISQISNSGFGNNSEFYKFSNLQQLKNLLRDKNLFKLD